MGFPFEILNIRIPIIPHHRNIENSNNRCQSPVNCRESKEVINANRKIKEIEELSIEYFHKKWKSCIFLNEKPSKPMPTIADTKAKGAMLLCIKFSIEPPSGQPASQEKKPSTKIPDPKIIINVEPIRVFFCFLSIIKSEIPKIAIKIPVGIKPAAFIKSAFGVSVAPSSLIK